MIPFGVDLICLSVLWGFILATVAIVSNANTSPLWLILLAANNIKITNFKISFNKVVRGFFAHLILTYIFLQPQVKGNCKPLNVN